MAGHNRWSKIKRKKEVIGSAKGKLYSKLIKELTVAARIGGGDPAGNARLRATIDAAREANMPNDTIQRAIKRGTGEIEGAAYEEVSYEGYGPGGVAVLIECLTDNRNRTAGEVRAAFNRGGGALAETNAVRFMFDHVGAIGVQGADEDRLMEVALDAGAVDVLDQGEDGFEVRTAPSDVHKVAEALEQAGLKPVEPKAIWVPQTTVRLEGDNAKKMLKLMEMLDDNDDVQNVYANFEIDEALMEELAG